MDWAFAGKNPRCMTRHDARYCVATCCHYERGDCNINAQPKISVLIHPQSVNPLLVNPQSVPLHQCPAQGQACVAGVRQVDKQTAESGKR